METEQFQALTQQLNKLIALNQKLVAQGRKSLLDEDQVLSFNAFGEDIRLFLPNVASDGLQGMIADAGAFFEANLLGKVYVRNLIPTGGTVLDIGCNIGNHTVFFSKVMKAGRVISFDLQPYCQRVVERNIKENKLKGVTFENLGMGSEKHKARISRFLPNNLGATSFERSEDGEFQIDTLDSYCASKTLNSIDFVKIDVEGMAVEVLQGAKKTLSELKPYLWVELIPRWGEVEPATEVLKECGYELAFQLGRTDFMFHHTENPIPES